ncbi:MAG: sigma-70 family RNA polymerase sigma factor [Pseudomonadales bacterium]|nr:RNA polymerase sigma factor [Pseudomonadales bacterium]NIX06675.1 sigma-70 family RNA polymerase sigma factor [Pseudomonadales bacterium]
MTQPARETFAARLQVHLGRLRRLALVLTENSADAEDLVQDVVLKLCARRREVAQIRDLSTWLNRVLYNQFVDDRRRRRRQPLHLVGTVEDLDAASPGESREPLLEALYAARDERLRDALGTLSPDQRMVLLLHDSEGYRLTEIHQLTDIPLGTLKSRLHRARLRLRALLDDDVVREDAPEPGHP